MFEESIKKMMMLCAQEILEDIYLSMFKETQKQGYEVIRKTFPSASEFDVFCIQQQAWSSALKKITQESTPQMSAPPVRKTLTREEFFASENNSPSIVPSETDDFEWYNQRERAEESILKKHGYSVAKGNGMSANQRQDLLEHLIKTKQVSKEYVISLLEHLIQINGRKDGNQEAVSKWTADLKFVRNLRNI